MSATTNYAKVFRRAEWPSTVEAVYLLTPEPVGGAMVKAPRAQGEALAAIATTGALLADWVSTVKPTLRLPNEEHSGGPTCPMVVRVAPEGPLKGTRRWSNYS